MKMESIIARILLWPMLSMSESIEKIHAEMDKTAPDDPWLEEDKKLDPLYPKN